MDVRALRRHPTHIRPHIKTSRIDFPLPRHILVEKPEFTFLTLEIRFRHGINGVGGSTPYAPDRERCAVVPSPQDILPYVGVAIPRGDGYTLSRNHGVSRPALDIEYLRGQFP